MQLHYGTVQIAVAAAFAGLTLVFAAVFLTVGLSARRDVAFERVQSSGYRLRKLWLALLTVVLVCGLGVSFFFLPYAGRASAGTTVVEVKGGQFFWSLSPSRVPAGSHVRFDVTSVDVNHGFGLYDPSGRLLGSVQAMPRYHNKLDLTLSDPGSYLVRCLEYCGLNHATMEAVFTVTGPA